MDKVRGVIETELTVEEVTTINALIERDTAMAVIKTDMGNYKCPACKSYVSSNKVFCTECGQRIDWDNIAL